MVSSGLQAGLAVLDGKVASAQFLPRLGFVNPVFGLPISGAKTSVQTQGIGVPSHLPHEPMRLIYDGTARFVGTEVGAPPVGQPGNTL